MTRARLLFLVAVTTACVDRKPAVDYGDPTDLNTPTTVGGINAYVVSPRITDTLDGSQIQLVFAAWTDDAAPLRVTLSVDGATSTVLSPQGADGPDQRYIARVSLLHGLNNLRIRAGTLDGARIRFFDYGLRYSGAAPGIRLSLYDRGGQQGACGNPILYAVTGLKEVCVATQVSTASGDVQSVAVTFASTSSGDQAATTDASGKLEGYFPLRDNTTETISATVGETTASVDVVQDSTPPVITVDNANANTDADSIQLTGTATDLNGVASIAVEIGGGSQRVAVATPWSTKVFLETGANSFYVTAFDLAGNYSFTPVTITRNRLITLRAPTLNAGGTDLTLDKAALQSLLPNVADQQAIEMVRVPLRPAILSALEAIRDPVASGLDTSAWGAAEWNLWRLLNMTPDNADLRGSSVEAMLALADAVGIPKARVLADVFDINVLTTFVTESFLADVLIDQLVATHPNMLDSNGMVIKDANGNVALALTLYDALQNLSPVAPRFGPSGSHPGFLTGTSSSFVFEPGFLMTVPVRSNLTQYDGVSAGGTQTAPGATKDYLFQLEGAQVLEFDFLSTNFTVVGLVDEPKVDLSFLITEATTSACSTQPCNKAGTTQNAGADATRPGFYRGNSSVWTLPLYRTESIVAETGYRQLYNKFATSYQRTFSYDAGSIMNAATISWNRGWIDIQTSGGIGSPPPPLYAWDLLHEVAQIRLHDGGIAEGAASTKFTLLDLPIGLTADQLIEQMRPTLQAKQAELSNRLIGTGGLTTSGVDIYFVPNAGGGGFFFANDARAPSTPGFFANAALTTKISTTAALSGTTDTTHEKIAVAANQSFYFKAADATSTERVYQLTVTALTATTVTVRVAEVTP